MPEEVFYICGAKNCHHEQTHDGDCDKCGFDVFERDDGSWPCSECGEEDRVNYGGMCEPCIEKQKQLDDEFEDEPDSEPEQEEPMPPNPNELPTVKINLKVCTRCGQPTDKPHLGNDCLPGFHPDRKVDFSVFEPDQPLGKLLDERLRAIREGEPHDPEHEELQRVVEERDLLRRLVIAVDDDVAQVAQFEGDFLDCEDDDSRAWAAGRTMHTVRRLAEEFRKEHHEPEEGDWEAALHAALLKGIK